MSTRALYTFLAGPNDQHSWNVYKHSDGYPTGAACTLTTAMKVFAWPLPRYEADEFAAAFCAAGKSNWFHDGEFDEERLKLFGPGGEYSNSRGGNVRLMPQGEPLAVAVSECSDIEYRYEISPDGETLRVVAFKVSCWEPPGEQTLIIDCKIDEFAAKAYAYQNPPQTVGKRIRRRIVVGGGRG